MTATATRQPGGVAWYALPAQDVTDRMGVRTAEGLAPADVERQRAEYGTNELPTEPPPSMWTVAPGQLANPMNIMLLIVVAASFAIVQIATALVVLGLVTFAVRPAVGGRARPVTAGPRRRRRQGPPAAAAEQDRTSGKRLMGPEGERPDQP